MNESIYENKEYWNRLRRARDYHVEERVVPDGNDGEDEFDAKILDGVMGKVVLDVGCGLGEFTIRMAERAKEAVGIDFSHEAVLRARKNLSQSGRMNVRFEEANANKLPSSGETFDVVVSRRGPITDTKRSLSEAYRVLAKGGVLMEITIGENDKANITRIFGRGQMFGIKEQVSISKRRTLEAAGFRTVEINDYLATEIFEDMRDLIVRLNSAPIIPNFDSRRDGEFLKIVEARCKTSRGIETEVHRVTIIASK